MEITAEVTKEEYRSIVKSYFLEKDWTKRAAILVIAAVIISVCMTWSYHGFGNYWQYFYASFSFFLCILTLVFFVAPYAFAYNTVRVKLKKEGGQIGTLVYQVTDKGITVDINGVNSFYLWGKIHTIKVLVEHIVLISKSNDIIIFPTRSLPNGDSGSLLQLINGYHIFRIV